MKLNCTIFIISCILLACQHAKLKLNTNKNVTAPTCKFQSHFNRMLTLFFVCLFLLQVMCRCTCGHVTFSGGIRNLIVFGDISFKIQCTHQKWRTCISRSAKKRVKHIVLVYNAHPSCKIKNLDKIPPIMDKKIQY
jgi:hypothetical protein